MPDEAKRVVELEAPPRRARGESGLVALVGEAVEAAVARGLSSEGRKPEAAAGVASAARAGAEIAVKAVMRGRGGWIAAGALAAALVFAVLGLGWSRLTALETTAARAVDLQGLRDEVEDQRAAFEVEQAYQGALAEYLTLTAETNENTSAAMIKIMTRLAVADGVKVSDIEIPEQTSPPPEVQMKAKASK